MTIETGFILAIRTTLAIGATMATLEIMLTMASPLAVAHKEEVEEETIVAHKNQVVGWE